MKWCRYKSFGFERAKFKKWTRPTSDNVEGASAWTIPVWKDEVGTSNSNSGFLTGLDETANRREEAQERSGEAKVNGCDREQDPQGDGVDQMAVVPRKPRAGSI